jgi:sugar lactone lactonase YvrE
MLRPKKAAARRAVDSASASLTREIIMKSASAPSLNRIAALCAVTLAAHAGTAAANPQAPTYGITPYVQVPADPGFPEGIAVHHDTVFVSGPARFGTAGTGPSAIQVYDRETGQHQQTLQINGEALAYEHALSNVATDCKGGVFGLSTQLGLIHFVRQQDNYIQQAYGAPLPDLPTCGPGVTGACAPTSPAFVDFPPIINDLAFDKEGNAYVTDSLQATIFRYPPGGGVPEIWFQSPQLQGSGPVPFGTNGIRIDPKGEYVYFVTTTGPINPALGTIYRLPLKTGNTEADLEVVHQYTQGEGPDQIAFGKKGDLYVTLALSNQVSILKTDGSEVRFGSQAGDPIPLDSPANLAFDRKSKSLLIVNHALFSGNPAHFAVLRADVRDAGTPLVEPCGEAAADDSEDD